MVDAFRMLARRVKPKRSGQGIPAEFVRRYERNSAFFFSRLPNYCIFAFAERRPMQGCRSADHILILID